MAKVKLYALNYMNVDPPFKIKVRYREGIDVLLKE